MSALGSVVPVQVAIACWDFSDCCHSFFLSHLLWLFPELRQEHSSTRQHAEERSTSHGRISFLFLSLLTGHRMAYGAGESNTKLFPLQT